MVIWRCYRYGIFDVGYSTLNIILKQLHLPLNRYALLLLLQDDVEVKLLMGDELRLKHKAAGAKGSWEGTGHVISSGGATEEVGGKVVCMHQGCTFSKKQRQVDTKFSVGKLKLL